MKLLLDRILVKKLSKDEASIGGIALLNKVANTLNKGRVLAVGPGRKSADNTLIPMTLKVGDTVVFDQLPQQPVILNGEEVLVLYEGEIIGTL